MAILLQEHDHSRLFCFDFHMLRHVFLESCQDHWILRGYGGGTKQQMRHDMRVMILTVKSLEPNIVQDVYVFLRRVFRHGLIGAIDI